jgi:hypothetical protein
LNHLNRMSSCNIIGDHFRPSQIAFILIVRSGSRQFQLTCSLQEGAVVIFPDGATRVDYKFRHTMLHYAQHHVPSWYQHVNGTLGVKARNGDLYLVTGTDKASNWCLASYSSGSGESNILKFSSTDIDDTSATGQFLWESSGPIEARTCPVPGEGNQCAFVRGFKLALNETLYQKCFESPTKTCHVSMSRPWWRRILWAIISRWYSRCEQTSAVLSDVTGGPHPVFKLESFPKLSEVQISALAQFCILKFCFQAISSFGCHQSAPSSYG